MKNFTKQNFKTNPLWIRLLIMTFMLLAGAGSAWAAVTIYFDNTNTKWSNVYVYLYSDAYWSNEKGSGSNNIKWCNNGQPMSYVANNIYSITINNVTHNSGIVAFTEGNQCGYENFWETKASYHEDYNSSKPVFKPITTSSTTKNRTTYYNEGSWSVYTPPVVEPCTDKYYLKHDFGGDGGDWHWYELTDCENNIYTLTAIYGGTGCNYSKPNSTNEDGYIASPTLVGSPVKGDECIFTFDSKNKSITITKVVKCQSTSYTLSFADNVTAVNKGATVQASVSPGSGIGTVTWESGTKTVATISNTGLITGVKYGTSEITATIADGSTYCGGTAKKTITVKETPTISISGATTFCGTSTTLTADISNLTTANKDGKTITWYKDGGASYVGTGATYNATATGTYTAKITGTYIKETTSDGFSVTKKATPTAANFTYVAPSNLTYSGLTKSATVDWNGTQGGDIT